MAQTSKPGSSGTGVYRRLLQYSFSQWKLLSIAIAGMAVSAMTEPAFAALMRPLLDGSFVERDPAALKWVPVMMLLIFIARGLSNFLSSFFMEKVGRTVIQNLRDEVFAKYLALPTSAFDTTSKGELIARVTFNTEQVANAATDSLTILIRDTITIIGLLAWMFYLSWEMALGVLIVAPAVSLIVAAVTRRFRKISKSIQGSMGDVTHVTEEAIDGQRVVKVFGGQDYELNRFADVNRKNTELHVKLAKVKSATTPVVQFLVALVLAGIVVFATQESFQDQITVGTFMSFMTAMMMLLTPIRRLTNVNVMIQKGIAAGEDIFALLDSPEEIDQGKASVKSPVAGKLKFTDVGFRYTSDAGPVLAGINLTVEPGQTVALVGRSGSGKTTLVNLLPRLYELSDGEISLDGVAIDQIPLKRLRDQIAYVGQHVTLFSGSIRNNIAYGRLDAASEADIVAAAKAAYAWEFIERLPEGLDTEVGENGVLLSGGQRQRLAIARALLKDAPVLILDEATAALDTESERYIQAALEEVCKGRTTLVIAHRLSTVENADCIVVMQDGEIVESGRHQELLEKDGVYAMLHGMQFSES